MMRLNEIPTRVQAWMNFMETFFEAAMHIADGAELETFVEPTNPLPDA